jgi:CHAT domain-containing protein
VDLTQKKYKEARRYYKSAYEIYKDNFGNSHPSLIDSYISLGIVSSYLNDFEKYYSFNKKAFGLYREYRMNNFSLLDSKQKLDYSKSNRYYVASLFHSATEYKKGLKKKSRKEIDQFVLNSWLNYKRSIFDIENSLDIIVQKSKSPKVKKQIEKLNLTKRELAKLYQESGNYEDIKKYKKKIETLRETLSKLQKKLSATVQEYRDELNLEDISYEEIAKRLKPKELYLDFAKIGDFYYYFILDKKQNIIFKRFDHTISKEIDANIKSVQKETSKIIKGKTFADIALAKKQYGKIYDLILKEIDISKSNSLIISPDGLLNLVPFEAFYSTKEKKYLVEILNIRYIPSGKELVRLYQNSNKSRKNIVVFANPNFGLKIPSGKSRRGTIDALYHQAKSLNRVNALFSPLSGTIEEADNIKKLFRDNTELYMKNRANEANLFKIKSPKILHLSTHGFFIKDKKIINPLLKSGIALSGANHAIKTKTGNGIITGLELAGINLNGTELVVLSACETGVGEIEEAEGVAGINKAFMRAGAKQVVMSLWSVSDKATTWLMEEFYKGINDGKSYSEALREAKIFMIDNKNSHPYYWSGFVGSGKD